ncbi:MAG TPA: sigma-70 family RNA polymerase sigma factor [Planctomycetota bacterium]
MPFPFASPDRLLASFQRTGDPRALGKLFDRTAPELLRVAAWLAGNRTDAEDLLQRTFLTVLTSRGNYDATRRALPWLCGILGNHCRKLHEQRQLRARIEPAEVRERERDPHEAAAAAEFAATVARLRAELGSPYAEVLDLHLRDGLDCKQIAERLGRPGGTVRTQLMRGLQRLRQVLPGGFVAGAALTAHAQAAVLAAVRTFVLGEAKAGVAATAAGGAGAVGGVMTFGGLAMGKKLVWLVPGLLLVLGGGTFWWQQRTADAPPPASPVAVAAPLPAATSPQAAPASPAAADRVERQEVAATGEPAAEPGFATLLVRMRWADDGTPAADAGVSARPQPGSQLTEREGLTDAQGRLVLRRVRPGPCWVTTAFTEVARLELAAGAVRTLDLDAKRTGFVTGTVVDANQRPVADARLWLSEDGSPFRGFEVGRSDAVGRFRLSFVDGQHLGARKAGHAPSQLHGLTKSTENVVLTLDGAGGSVHGRVVDADHRPIAGARVEIGPTGGGVIGSTFGVRHTQPTAPKLTTDVRGEFVCEGIVIGNTKVKAWAAGFGPISERVAIEEARAAHVVLVLPRAASVAGVVRDAAGRAVAHATVTRSGTYYEFGRPLTETEDDGTFRLTDLPAGSVTLSVIARDGKVEESVATTAGATTTWNPVVAGKRQLTGRVVGPDGAPLPKLLVGVLPPQQFHAHPQTTTDERGAFELRGFDAGPVTLLVESDAATLATRTIEPSGEPIVITLTATELPTAHLRGRVVDTAGKPLAARLTLRLASWRSCPYTETGADGTFHRGLMPAGNYLVTVEANGYGSTNAGVVRVAPGEDKTMPDLVLARAGRVVLELRDNPAAHTGMIKVSRDDGAAAAWLTPEGNRATAELPPGAYFAVAEGSRKVGSVAFRVDSEQTTSAVLTFVAAESVTFVCRIDATSADDIIVLVVRDSGGALAGSAELHVVNRRDGKPLEWRTLLPPGQFTVQARASDGRSAAADFTVTAGARLQGVVLEFAPR